MKKHTLLTRYNLFWLIVLCYLLPLLGLSLYGALVPREEADWNILSVGFLLSACGSMVFFLLMTRWEQGLSGIKLNEFSYDREDQNPELELAKQSLVDAQQAQGILYTEINLLEDELLKTRRMREEDLLQMEKVQEELEQNKRTARHQMELQQNHIRELQETLADQKILCEKKQQQMLQLETKVGDLTYEIKTLLKFAEGHSSSLFSDEIPEPILQEDPEPVRVEMLQEVKFHENTSQAAYEASRQLQYCLDIAQKIKGSQRFGSQIYSFLDSPADSFSLDLRRLCDRLRSDVPSIILLYSPIDNNMLFASNQIKTLTGWSPEKFAQNFSEILLDESEWKRGVSSLAIRSEAQIKLQLKTRTGPNLEVNASLGMIPTGIFRNHTIAVVYS